MNTEDGAIPIAGVDSLALAKHGTIEAPGEVQLAENQREVNPPQGDHNIEDPRIPQGLLKANKGRGGTKLRVGPSGPTEWRDSPVQESQHGD